MAQPCFAAEHPQDEGTPWEWSQQSFPGQFSFSQQCFGNSHSSGTYGSFKPPSLPNNPPSWEVLILQLSAASWYSTLCASPWKSLRCHSHAAITCSSFLSSQSFPELRLNSLLTNHPARKAGSGVWGRGLTQKNFGQSFWGSTRGMLWLASPQM